jgi:hypothetical protein
MGSHQAMAGNASAVFQNSGLSEYNCYFSDQNGNDLNNQTIVKDITSQIASGKIGTTFSISQNIVLDSTDFTQVYITPCSTCPPSDFNAANDWGQKWLKIDGNTFYYNTPPPPIVQFNEVSNSRVIEIGAGATALDTLVARSYTGTMVVYCSQPPP